MKIRQTLCVIVALFSGAQAEDSAQAQDAKIWSQIKSTEGKNADFSTLGSASILVMDMKLPFAQTDYMQTEPLIGVRPKAIHTKGVVQQVRWESLPGHSYTGLFATGADYGIMRYSVAKPYDASKWGSSSTFLPGMGIKWYRDGVHSANLQAMPGFSPTQNPNFFTNDFSNHVKPIDDLAIKVLAHLFAKATPYATSMGLRDWAEYTKSGNAVASPNMPFQLIYEPQVSIPSDIPSSGPAP